MNKELEPKVTEDKPNKSNLLKKIWLYSLLTFIISLVLDILRVGFVSDMAPLWISLPLITSALVLLFSFPIWLIIWLHSKKIVWKFVKVVAIILGSLVFLIVLWTIFFRYATIDGISMEPSYKNGDTYLISKFAYKSTDPKRGDVVDYYLFDKFNERIGRIVALPNETVILAPGELTINATKLNEPYSDWTNWNITEAKQLKLNDGEYLILSDKRSSALLLTNEEIVPISKSNIIGKFIFKLFTVK